jgi:hypothetical protein
MLNRSLPIAAALLLSAVAAFAQSEKPMDCQAMMQDMQKSMKSMDDRLQPLVAKMNQAKGSARTDALVAVVNELVAQRQQMRDQMGSMMPQMMDHMLQHMQHGMMQGMVDSMKSCPMMQMQGKQQGHEPQH